MLRHIDGKVDLSVPLYVQPDVLGMKISVRIDEHNGTIGFPLAPDTGFPAAGEVALLQSAVLGVRPLPETTLAGSLGARWGYIGIASGEAFVESLRIRISIGGTGGFVPDQMRTFGRAFDMWYSTVRDWVCAWSGQLRHREFDHEESRVRATISVDGKAGLYGSGITGGRVVIGETAVTREQVESAFYCASKGYALPLQHALLQRAQSDFMNGNFRQAAINACTAAEVSLSTAVRAALNYANVREKTVTNIMRQSSGAVEIFRLFVITGGKSTVSDDRVMDQLAKPRNDAVHAGVSSTQNDAQRAIATANAIVEAAAPLPEPADAKRSARKSTDL